MYCNKCKKEMVETRGSHRYTECGLDNVILHNIEVFKCPKCEKTIPILIHVDRLHKLIADNLTVRKEVLGGKEVRFIRKMMNMKAVELASILSVSKQRVSQWENDKGRISIANDRLIKAMYQYPEVCKALRVLTPTPEPLFNLDFPTFLASIHNKELSEAVCY